jgi:LysR family transcriptional regulator, pca operon transcriptional activator
MTIKRHLEQRLRLAHLRAVDAIAAQGSLLKASAALSLTQPALSKTLHEAEDILGAKLFDRHPRGVTPTAAGAAFVETARRMMGELRRLDEALDIVSHPGRGALALGVLPVAASGVLPGALTRMRAAHPQVRVRLEQGRTEELLPLLASGEIDMIVGRLYEPEAPDGFEREPLWSEPIALLARPGHPILALNTIENEHLRGYDLALPTVGQRVGREIEWILQRLGLESTVAYRSSSYDFIREMVMGGDFLSIMPSLMMAGDLLRGALQLAPLPLPHNQRLAGVIRRVGGAPTPAGRAFLDALKGFVGELAERGFADITIGNSGS